MARGRVRRTLGAVLLAGAWVASAVAHAQTSGEPAAATGEEATLADARTALEQRRYVAALDKASPLRRSASRQARAEALEIVAIAALAAGRKADGEAALRELYELQPGFELVDSSLPEPVRHAFEAEAARPNAGRVALRMTASSRGGPAVEVSADKPVSAVRLACRVEAGLAFAPLATTGSGASYRGELRSARPHACIAVALDGDGLVVGRQGSRARPVELRPPARSASTAVAPAAAGPDQQQRATPASGPALTERWWFWAAIGTLVVAGTVTVIVAAAASSDGPPTEEVGTNRPTLFSF